MNHSQLERAKSVGLNESDYKTILKVFNSFPDLRRVVLFGSRALGNYQNGSDFDLAVSFNQNEHQQMLELSMELNENNTLPYRFDLCVHGSIKNESLRLHVERVGVLIYRDL